MMAGQVIAQCAAACTLRMSDIMSDVDEVCKV